MTRARAWLGVLVMAAVIGWPIGRMVAQAPAPQVTVAEAESTRPGVPPASVPPSETLGWMFTFGILVNEAMKRMKASAWFPWMVSGRGKVNIIIAALLAGASAAGIHTEFDQAAGTFLVTGLTWTGIAHFGGEWLRQWTLQQFTYQAMKPDH